MKRTLTLLLLIFSCWQPIAHAQAGVQTQSLVFTHVTIIDTLRGTLNKDVTVVISGDRIIALGRTRGVPVPKDAQVVDASYDERKALALFKRLARNGTHAVPTLVLHYSLGLGPNPRVRNDPRLKYMPASVKQIFAWELEFFPAWRPVFERMLTMTNAMHRAGVKILAGTDTPNTYCFPGFSVHDELERSELNYQV